MIIHPFSLQDFAFLLPQIKYIPKAIIERSARFLPPFQVSVLKGIRSENGLFSAEAEGELRCCPLMTQDFLSLPEEVIQRKVISTVESAKKNGAKLVGLGGWTGLIGERGSTIAHKAGIPVSTGDGLTLYFALEAVKLAVQTKGIDWNTVNLLILGVPGLTDSVSVCARLLARENHYLRLVVREYGKFDKTASEILYETGVAVSVSGNLQEFVRQADVLISFTTAEDSFEDIEAGDLKQGAIVCDIFWPRNLAKKLARERKDVLVIEGGVVSIPGSVAGDFRWKNLSSKCPAWMAEVMILALEKRYETYSLGNNIGIGQVEEIGRLAHKHGFKLAGFQVLEDCWSRDLFY